MSVQKLTEKITQEVYSLTFPDDQDASDKWRRLGEAKLELLIDKARAQWQESLDDIQRIKADYECESKQWLEWRNKYSCSATQQQKKARAKDHSDVISELTTDLEMKISEECALNHRIKTMTAILKNKQYQRKQKEDEKLAMWAREKRIDIEYQITELAKQLPILASFITKNSLEHMGAPEGFARDAVRHTVSTYKAIDAVQTMLPEYRAAALKDIARIEKAERAAGKAMRERAGDEQAITAIQSEAGEASEAQSSKESDAKPESHEYPGTQQADRGNVLNMATHSENFGVFGECTNEVPEAFKDMAASK